MAASFPGAVKAFSARSNGQVIDATHVGDLQDEVNAIEDGYLSGTARLNSSNSTLAKLSVTGGSTFAGAVNIIGAISLNSSAGTTGQVLTSGGSSAATWGSAGSAVSDRNVTLTNVVNTAVETVLFSSTIVGGTLGTNRTLRFTFIGDHYNQSSTADTPTFRLKWGGGTILSWALTALSGAGNRRNVRWVSYLSAANAASSQYASGSMLVNNSGAGAGAMTLSQGATEDSAVNSTITVDSSTNQTFQFTVQHGFANSSLSVRLLNAFLELL